MEGSLAEIVQNLQVLSIQYVENEFDISFFRSAAFLMLCKIQMIFQTIFYGLK